MEKGSTGVKKNNIWDPKIRHVKLMYLQLKIYRCIALFRLSVNKFNGSEKYRIWMWFKMIYISTLPEMSLTQILRTPL